MHVGVILCTVARYWCRDILVENSPPSLLVDWKTSGHSFPDSTMLWNYHSKAILILFLPGGPDLSAHPFHLHIPKQACMDPLLPEVHPH